MARSITYGVPSNSRTSLGGDESAMPPLPSYRHGSPPSATCVPTPAGVKNAGMPAPPARSRSAKVPCGTNSTSSSPDRNCRSNSLFSPTYDPVVRRILLADSSIPRPHSSTPQLLLTVSSSSTPAASSASISAVGMPQRPKPPTASEAPLGMSATASAALPTTLSICCPSVLQATSEKPSGHTVAVLETVWRPRLPVDVVRTLEPLRRGTGDPTHRVDLGGVVWRT